jgi:hypothetical protein
LSCAGDTANNKSGIINPNGDSELALLMREMHDDGMLTKQQILEGQMPEVKCDYQSMYTIEATEPEKVASVDYKLFGKAYEASVAALLASDEANRASAYQTMVGACMNCHQAMCPGPMVKIKKMYLSEEQIAALEN